MFKCKSRLDFTGILLKNSGSHWCFCRKLWCVLFTSYVKVGLDTFKLLVLLLLLEGDLNCNLQKKKRPGSDTGDLWETILGGYCTTATDLLPSLSCSLPQFPLCQNWRSNAAGL